MGGFKSFCMGCCKNEFAQWKKSLAMSVYPVESIKKDGWQRSTEMVKGSIEY